MPNRNPGVHLHCPICPRVLRYVTTRCSDEVSTTRNTAKAIADVHVYECAAHGRFHMGPNRRLIEGA